MGGLIASPNVAWPNLQTKIAAGNDEAVMLVGVDGQPHLIAR